MSRTDKTRPWWVRMVDEPMVTCLPVPDHRFGACTPPDEITADTASLSHRGDGCYWGCHPLLPVRLRQQRRLP